MDYREYFKKRTLLTDGKSNTKTAKNSMATYYLSLQPTNLNSKRVNLCRFSTKECRDACLQYAGRQSFGNVVLSRSRKTEFYVNDTEFFIEKLWRELEELNKKGNVAIRLNLLSDINWDEEFAKVNSNYKICLLSNIQFYDYTKDHFKVMANQALNYNLTFSFSGYNWKIADKLLKGKIANVAVVFKNALPLQWNGYEVIDGDLSDERFLDTKGQIIGLKYKTPRGLKYQKTKFVIDEQEENKNS